LDRIPIDRVKRLALVAKTEGTATINDFSRELALGAAAETLREMGGGDLVDRSTLIFSTGSEGILSPCVTVLAAIDDGAGTADAAGGMARLVMGGARTRPMAAAELATPEHVRLIADAVDGAMAEAELTPDQVSLVFVKSPILTPHAAAETGDAAVMARAGSSGLSRGAAALGVAAALGEIDRAEIATIRIGADLDRHASRAMSFSGTELDFGEVLVLGNRPGMAGDAMIFSRTLSDILDALRPTCGRCFSRSASRRTGACAAAGRPFSKANSIPTSTCARRQAA
jgi:cyanuric acid amidohydrolase